MDQLECKDPNQWHVVNLSKIGGKIRHEKRIIKGQFELACGLIRVKQNLEGKRGEKKEAR